MTVLDNYFDPEDLTDDLPDLATVIVPGSGVAGSRLGSAGGATSLAVVSAAE